MKETEPTPSTAIQLREFRYPEDVATLSELDASFTTERIYRPLSEGLSFQLREERIAPPLSKRYPLDAASPEERALWDCAIIAEAEGEVVGFAAAQYAAWNRRAVLHHLYVSPQRRRQGIGAQLLAAIEKYARSTQARLLWFETQNVNYPAIQFYQSAGFAFCGYDSSLYDPAETPQEIALFFARPTPYPETERQTPNCPPKRGLRRSVTEVGRGYAC